MVIWNGGKSIIYCVFLLCTNILISRRSCDVAKGLAIVDGCGRFLSPSQEKGQILASTWFHNCHYTSLKREFDAPSNRVYN